MPVPLPTTEVNLHPPDHDEVVITARACVSALRGDGQLQDLQRYILCAHIESMCGVHLEVDSLEHIGPEDFAEAMRYREEGFRIRMVQTMLLGAFVVSPPEDATIDRIALYADALCVSDGMIEIGHEIAHGSHNLVLADFSRAGYHAHLDTPIEKILHTREILSDDWDPIYDEPELAQRWDDLGKLPSGTLGRGVWEFYRARGFSFPGAPGSAPPLLSQHDWVHVIADYGSTVESEIEVFGLISRADDDPRAFSLLAMVLSLFETGMLHSAAIFQFDPGHLSHDARRMGIRLADAMYRGAIIGAHFSGQDLLEIDWFKHAHKTVEEVREMVGIPQKSEAAIAAGAVGPWEPGGISPFQLNLGISVAAERGEEYDNHGATVLEGASEGY
ncbi:MAG: hypothetical protein F2894_07360 [Actinobacteria bacterium]|uniref:Unannotated protein n=1 Tax=freshwater metagenome TaxID=449393 RepID=A0A6J7P556_9ZZZZ|nr:hypothetical protein [Actinomycetota bacterium]MSW06008.1 hypothetical protein [Actinomycetota bacterium]MSX82137.1 hypothetical protein [Actinomycetota bacterium]MSY06248.1 hypothetical protein [Actinomycetota bacterium]MSZ28839.1 hypothetical protein [Actinomycetota bacterium]